MQAPDPGVPRPPRGAGLQTLVHATVLTAGLLVVYFVLPLDQPFTGRTVAALVVGLICVALLLAWQLRVIARARFPRLQAVKTFALIVPLFFVMFSITYYLLERSTPGSFNQPLTRLDALYFTMTVFSTVGFGDIAADTQLARGVVTGQIAADLVLVGAAARLVVGAVGEGVRRRDREFEG